MSMLTPVQFNNKLKLYNIIDELQYIDTNSNGRYYDTSINIGYGESFSWTPALALTLEPTSNGRYLYVTTDPALLLNGYDTSVGTWLKYNSWQDISVTHNGSYGYGNKNLRYTFETDTSLSHEQNQPVIIGAPTFSVSAALILEQLSTAFNARFTTRNINIEAPVPEMTVLSGETFNINFPVNLWHRDYSFNGLPDIGQYMTEGYNGAAFYPYDSIQGYPTSGTLTQGITDNSGLNLKYLQPCKETLTISQRLSAQVVATLKVLVTVVPWLPSADSTALYMEDLGITVLTSKTSASNTTTNVLRTSVTATVTSNVGETTYSPGSEIILYNYWSNYYYIKHAPDYVYSPIDSYNINVIYQNAPYDFSYNFNLLPRKMTNYNDTRLGKVIDDILADNVIPSTELYSKVLIFDLPPAETQGAQYFLDVSGQDGRRIQGQGRGRSLNCRIDTQYVYHISRLATLQLDITLTGGAAVNLSGTLLGNVTYNQPLTQELLDSIRVFSYDVGQVTLGVHDATRPSYNYIIDVNAPTVPRVYGSYHDSQYITPCLPDISLNLDNLYFDGTHQINYSLYIQNIYTAWRGAINDAMGNYPINIAVNGVTDMAYELNRWLALGTDDPDRTTSNGFMTANASNSRFTANGHILYLTSQDPATCEITRYYDDNNNVYLAAVLDYSLNSRTNLATRVITSTDTINQTIIGYSGVYFYDHGKIYDIREPGQGYDFAIPTQGYITHIISPFSGAIIGGLSADVKGTSSTDPLFWPVPDVPSATMYFPDGYNKLVYIDNTTSSTYSTAKPELDWRIDASFCVNVSASTIISDYPSNHPLSPGIDIAAEFGAGYSINTFLDASIISIADALRHNFIDICGALQGLYMTWQGLIDQGYATYTELLKPKYNLTDTILTSVGLPVASNSNYIRNIANALLNYMPADITQNNISLAITACLQPKYLYPSSWATIGGTPGNYTVTFILSDAQKTQAINTYNNYLTTIMNGNLPLTQICGDVDLSQISLYEYSYMSYDDPRNQVHDLCIKLMSLGIVDPGYLIAGPLGFDVDEAIWLGLVSQVYALAPLYRDLSLYSDRPYFTLQNFQTPWVSNYAARYMQPRFELERYERFTFGYMFGVITREELGDCGYYDFVKQDTERITASQVQYTWDGYNPISLGLGVSEGYHSNVLFYIDDLPRYFILSADGVSLLSLPKTSAGPALLSFVPVAPTLISKLSLTIPYDMTPGSYQIKYCCYLSSLIDAVLMSEITLTVVVPDYQYNLLPRTFIDLRNDLPAQLHLAADVPRLISASGLTHRFTSVTQL